MQLSYFATSPFVDALKKFFADDLHLPFTALGDDPVRLADILPDPPAYTQNIQDVYAVGLVNDDAFSGNQRLFAETTLSPKHYDGIIILGVTLKTQKSNLPKRGELAQIARAFNRAFHTTPVMVVFKYQVGKSTFIALANTERGDYKQQWRDGEKAGRVSLLRDIDINRIHPGHARILDELKVPKTITSFAALYEYWQEKLDVSLLNKRFYSDLSNWFFAARQFAQFPDPAENATERGLIRLITRLIFTWFIKERGLVPGALFDTKQIPHLLTDTAPDSGTYYRAVLQNLFFATLNTEMGQRRFRDEKRDLQNRNKDYGLHQYFRYKSTFADANEWLALIKDVPFLNGGLFECLDPEDKDGQRIDGFSDNPKRQAHLPNKLFWGDNWEADLSDIYNNKKQKAAEVKPLLNLLHSYKFTIAENTPLEQDVALDPELLGKVFENLLASYNPETKTTARKQTGSFYTPREIVNYMVEEALHAYLQSATNIAAQSEANAPRSAISDQRSAISDQRSAIFYPIPTHALQPNWAFPTSKSPRW